MSTMKHLCARATIAMLLAAGAPLLAATWKVRADVPFAFEVGGKVLPAGNYSFEVVANAHVLLVRGRNGQSATALVKVNQMKDRGVGGVSFDQASGSASLSKVVISLPMGVRDISLK